MLFKTFVNEPYGKQQQGDASQPQLCPLPSGGLAYDPCRLLFLLPLIHDLGELFGQPHHLPRQAVAGGAHLQAVARKACNLKGCPSFPPAKARPHRYGLQ